jgi:hypothetical protein
MSEKNETELRLERIARVAMAAAELIESIPYFNGVKQVSAYQTFDELWMTTLTAEDMTFMRGIVGLPEPTPAKGQS